MKKTVVSFIVAFSIMIALISIVVLLSIGISKDSEVLFIQEENSDVCLDLKEQVIVEEKNIETDFFWSKTYVIVCLSSDESARYRFTVSSEAYYNLPVGKRLLYCNKCDRIFEIVDK